MCGRGGKLDVHHARGYRNLGRERADELQALCRDCHNTLHASRQLWNTGCLGTLVWIVVIAIAMELVWWLLISVLHHFGMF